MKLAQIAHMIATEPDFIDELKTDLDSTLKKVGVQLTPEERDALQEFLKEEKATLLRLLQEEEPGQSYPWVDFTLVQTPLN